MATKITQKNNSNSDFSGTNQFFTFLYTIWFVVSFYTIFYGVMKAYVACAAVALGAFILSPLNIYLEKKNFKLLSRQLFLISCNFYIYATSLGFGHSVRIEYYFIPAVLIPLVIFDSSEKRNILISSLFPVFCWSLANFGGSDFIPSNWIFTPKNPNIFITVNFLGSYFIGGVFMVIFSRTINEQKLSLISSAKMSSLGEMAGGIAHEINSPLSVILIKSLQIKLQLQKEDLNKEAILSELIKIENTTHRIGKIIKGLKTFSRNSEKDDYQKVNVNEILEETLELCSEKIKAKNINFENKIETGIIIHCQPTQMSQIFMNLIQNSIDAIEDQAEPWIKITSYIESDKLKIKFIDSGNGIPKEVTDKMMQPFFTTKEVGKGTGLGLSITKGIVEDHKGKFYYDKTNANTTFVIELPVVAQNEKLISSKSS